MTLQCDSEELVIEMTLYTNNTNNNIDYYTKKYTKSTQRLMSYFTIRSQSEEFLSKTFRKTP